MKCNIFSYMMNHLAFYGGTIAPYVELSTTAKDKVQVERQFGQTRSYQGTH